ncbi:hypothetical protein [Agromyces sp. SYSU T00194]|uniref:hypothetical protein n=1 Tax=Agromyces chitinivorans TaxID=3158560 RepID=UPI003397CA73
MARTTTNKNAKTGAGVLRPLADPETAPPVSRIEDRKLLPIPFRPEAGRPDERDGAPLSRLGARFRDVFAEEHRIAVEEVDLGIVRQVEALNADTDRNMKALGEIQTKRTESGTLRFVRLTVNTPLIFPWMLNGRALRRMGSELRGSEVHLVTTAEDHPLLSLPTMAVDGPQSVLEIVSAQRRLLGLSNYTAADGPKKGRIDSIIQFGVLDPPDVVLTQLNSATGSAWVAQAAEGAQRLFSALAAMDVLANRNVASVATERWLRSAQPRLRDLTAEDLSTLSESLKFSSTAAAGYFPSATNIEGWVESVAAVTPAAVAFQLIRTMEVNLIVAVNPDPVIAERRGLAHPVSDTVQELIRSYHMPGKAKERWNDADVLGLIAIGAVDDLAADSRVSQTERSMWLGESLAEWSGPPQTDDGDPGNLLVSTTKLLAALTAQSAMSPADESSPVDSLEIVNQRLRLNSTRVHSDDRAKVAAAQAIAALGLNGSGWEGTIQAAIFGTFRHGWFWKTSEHQNEVIWPSLLSLSLAELTARAQAERSSRSADDDPDNAGPAQRAIAALGGLALMANPGLIAQRTALSRTGLGAGGKSNDISASDPSILLRTMAQHEVGITELSDAIAALTASAMPTIPLDRDDDQELTDVYLRQRWLGARTTSDNPQTEFARLVQELVDSLKRARDGEFGSERLKEILPGELLGQTPPDDELPLDTDYAPDLWGEPVYEEIGINEILVDEVIPVLQSLVDFFQVGKAYARAASRVSR